MTPEACGSSVAGLFCFISLNALVMPQKTFSGRSPAEPLKTQNSHKIVQHETAESKAAVRGNKEM